MLMHRFSQDAATCGARPVRQECLRFAVVLTPQTPKSHKFEFTHENHHLLCCSHHWLLPAPSLVGQCRCNSAGGCLGLVCGFPFLSKHRHQPAFLRQQPRAPARDRLRKGFSAIRPDHRGRRRADARIGAGSHRGAGGKLKQEKDYFVSVDETQGNHSSPGTACCLCRPNSSSARRGCCRGRNA